MRLRLKDFQRFTWLVLLVACFVSAHSFLDEVLETCPSFETQCPHAVVLGQGESGDSAHEHCVLVQVGSSQRLPFQVSLSSRLWTMVEEWILEASQTASWTALRHDRGEHARPPSCSAFHARVGLRLYA